MSGVSAARRVAGAGRQREAGGVRRRDVLGSTGAGLRRSGGANRVVGLAPAAHGANRTGRVFTGDRSGDWLFRALYHAGLANQPHSVSADDGLRLHGVWISAPVRCAPPDNKPTPAERDACAPFLDRELALIKPDVVVCLGAFGSLPCAGTTPCAPSEVRPRRRGRRRGGPALLCSYHPSQQNTFTGKLTEAMLDDVMHRAVTSPRTATWTWTYRKSWHSVPTSSRRSPVTASQGRSPAGRRSAVSACWA